MVDRVSEHREGSAERLHVGDEVFLDLHAGNLHRMIGVGIALIVVGIIFLFIIPWVGIPVGIVGLVLAILYFAGFGRRAARGQQPQ
jgi:Flp pilus assembly protein TadB